MKKTIGIMIILLMAGLTLAGCGPKADLSNFAKCVTASGMKFYGAYWCPHCQNVKKSFGSALKFIDYTECDEKGPKGNSAKCEADGIKAYPTFIFGDGMRIEGEMSLELIADKTGCELPK